MDGEETVFWQCRGGDSAKKTGKSVLEEKLRIQPHQVSVSIVSLLHYSTSLKVQLLDCLYSLDSWRSCSAVSDLSFWRPEASSPWSLRPCVFLTFNFKIWHKFELFTCTGIKFFIVLWRFDEVSRHRSHMSGVHQNL